MSYQGLRGYQDFATDEAPKSWEQGIRQISPWGHVQIVALAGDLIPKTPETSVYINWWTQSVESKVVSITAGYIFTNQALSSAYTSGGVVGQVLYVKMAAADQAHFVPQDLVMFRSNTYQELDTHGEVVASVPNGASSYVAVKLSEADDNGALISKDLSDVAGDGVLMESGGVSYDGAPIGTAVSYAATKWTNNHHTVRTPLEVTRRAMIERTRTMPMYDQVFAQSNMYQHIKLERIILWSILTESTATPNGKAQTTMDGLVTAMRTYEAANSQGNIKAWNRDSDFSGQEWAEGGWKWMEKYEEVCMREGEDNARRVLCGTYGFQAFTELAVEMGHIDISPMTTKFGMRIRQLTGSVLDLDLSVHPLFNQTALWKRAALGFLPGNLEITYLTDTMLKSDKEAYKEGGQIAVDGIKEEWLSDWSCKYFFPQCNFLWFGLGLTNTA
jgi:hypothetical protein